MIGQSTDHLFRSFRQVRAQKLHFLQNVLHVNMKEVDNRVGSLLHCPKYNLNLGTKKETGAALQMQWYRSGFSDLTVYLAQKTDKLYHSINAYVSSVAGPVFMRRLKFRVQNFKLCNQIS